MDLIKLIPELKARQNLVKQRMDALNMEYEDLRAEKQSLDDLIELYESKHYDSIEEERRVTECIHGCKTFKKAEPAEPKAQPSKSSDGMWEAIQTVLELDRGTAMSTTLIQGKVEELLGRKIKRSLMSNALWWLSQSKLDRITETKGLYKAK